MLIVRVFLILLFQFELNHQLSKEKSVAFAASCVGWIAFISMPGDHLQVILASRNLFRSEFFLYEGVFGLRSPLNWLG